MLFRSQSNNFLIKKTCFKQHLFNPDFSTYGYEDVDFAINLQKNKIEIRHIDNPIINHEIETAELFLQKLEKSMASLDVLQRHQPNAYLLENIKLLKISQKINKAKLGFFIKLIKFAAEKYLKKYLCSAQNPNLQWLSLYKLCLLYGMKKRLK